MHPILQIALCLASLAMLALTACAIPLLLQARRQLDALACFQADLEVLLRDSRELVRNANALILRADRELDDLGQVTRILRQWTERGDQLLEAVHALVAPPVISVLRNASAFRVGAGIFMKYVFGDRNHHLKGENHVRE